MNSYSSMPYGGNQNYGTHNTNQSMDATNQGQGVSWGAQSMYQKQGSNNFNQSHSNQNILRASSPPPMNSYNPLMNNFANGKANLFGGIISPQKGNIPFQMNQMYNPDTENL